MSLNFDVAPAEASWIVAGLPGFPDEAIWRRVLFGPDGFEAYARVLALPDPVRPGQSENDAEELSTELSDDEMISRVVDRMTGSDDGVELLFLLWEGWPYRPTLAPRRWIDLAGIRRYALARGTLRDWLTWADSGDERGFAPGFVWAADQSWCVAYDTDPHFAGVGGSAEAIDRLLRDPELTTVAQPAGAGLPPMYE
ncbi:hypothetical protein [Nocardioides albus]|uniref:Uncharacterized protein n=1 Tax=Nocardioides albus TaxID=1841 RepID=A0A7W5A047_9ACTN|nr:hypothetical protein [Nocardioides albus]MBB3087247.1 hypothetical protein [Nocardioides albus]GGU07686.1 hypothetical protein GCM10007979_01680 [Nocardioides albus]